MRLPTVEEVVSEVLFGPSIADIQHMIEPDAGLRILRQVCCSHSRRDWIRCMCLDCGITDKELFDEAKGTENTDDHAEQLRAEHRQSKQEGSSGQAG